MILEKSGTETVPVLQVGKDTYLTTAWDSEIHDQITIRLTNGKEETATLITGGETKGSLALYSFSKKPQIISTYLPKVGMHDMQMVSFINHSYVDILLGEYQEGPGVFYYPGRK